MNMHEGASVNPLFDPVDNFKIMSKPSNSIKTLTPHACAFQLELLTSISPILIGKTDEVLEYRVISSPRGDLV